MTQLPFAPSKNQAHRSNKALIQPKLYHDPSELCHQSSTMLLQNSGYLRIGQHSKRLLKLVWFQPYGSSVTPLTTFQRTTFFTFGSRPEFGRPRCNTTLCPSGLRGWTQVPLARAAWVQIPQVSFLRASSAILRCAYTFQEKQKFDKCQLWGSNPRGVDSSGS